MHWFMEVNYPLITIFYDRNILSGCMGFPRYLWLKFAITAARNELWCRMRYRPSNSFPILSSKAAAVIISKKYACSSN